MALVHDVDSFYNFIGYVVLTAPNRFPVRDYLAQDQQMNLDRAFAELRKGLQLVAAEVSDEEKKTNLSALLDDSLTAYRTGDDVRGAHLLNAFEALIFKR
jgi:hypothetical protein